MSLLDDAVDRIQRAMGKRIDAISPFRATVAATDSRGVYIQRHGTSTPDAEPYSRITSDHLVVGDLVMCSILNGKPVVMGKFIGDDPHGLFPALIPFSHDLGWLPYSTTNLTYAAGSWVAATTITIPPGTYRAVGAMTIPLRRNVNSGEMWSMVRIGGVDGPEAGVNVPAAVGAANVFFPISGAFDVTFTTADGSVVIEFGFRGGGTAGTTEIYRAAMSGSIVHVG